MGIENNLGRTGSAFTRAFGNLPSSRENNEDRPKAQFWLNVGYQTTVMVNDPSTGKEVKETRFISLPTGIALDTMDKLPANANNEMFRALQSAQNDLLDQVLSVAQKLEPGEEKIIGEGALVLQVRRVKGEAPAITAEANPFRMKLDL